VNATELGKDFETEAEKQIRMAKANNNRMDDTNNRMVELDGRMNKLIGASNQMCLWAIFILEIILLIVFLWVF
jgi:hypothetical protein